MALPLIGVNANLMRYHTLAPWQMLTSSWTISSGSSNTPP
jgi:hypothetical protein